MEVVGLLVLGFVVIVIVGVLLGMQEHERIQAMPPKQRQEYLDNLQDRLETQHYGPRNVNMVCPHCQTQRSIRTKPVQMKKGVSGGKATAALLTGGVSLLATGLSRKENLTQAHCKNCSNTWVF
jgi:hypothetical protein